MKAKVVWNKIRWPYR